MYIQLNSEKIKLDFNEGIRCSIDGPDTFYYVQVDEFVNGDDIPTYVEGYYLTKTDPARLSFTLPIEYFMDFQISISKFVDGIGLVNIFTHRFNDYGQYVRFILHSEDSDECNIWVNKIKEYQHKRGCKIILESPLDNLNKSFDSYYMAKSITPYKTYRIGRLPKVSNDFRTTDERCEGLIWFGYWKKFWSYQHPRNWNILNSEEIVNDILGLS